jgi:hypothetical protein
MKKIIENFNNLVKRTIFKVQKKTNSNFNISNFNKYLIISIASLFVYLFYLLTPLLYDKTWVQANIESKILNEFNVNLSTSADIFYRILPAPHFLIKDSKILIDDGEKKKSIAEVKDFKVFLGQSSLFNKEKMNIKKLVISNANFTLLRGDIKLLDQFKNKKLSNKKIKVNNSNIFFRNNLKEIILIIKIDKTVAFFSDKKLLNLINLKGEVFNTPFNLLSQNNTINYKMINFKSKPLKLNFSNESTTKNKFTSGVNNISFLNSTIVTKYNTKDKLIIFKSDNSRLDKSQINYNGELSINPFDLNLNVYLDNHKISKLFNINPILIEFIKSGLLFNNISIKNSITVSSDNKNEIFQNAKINLNVVNGRFNLNGTTFTNNDIGFFELSNSNLFLKNNNLILNTNILFKIKNSDSLFSFLNTSKKSRKTIKNILINLNYDYLSNEIKFNNVKIDNNDVSDQFLNIIEGFNDNNLNNLIKSKRLINKLLSIYEG